MEPSLAPDPAAVTLAEVDAICALDDPVLRNLRITECYHRLGAAFAATGVEGANWCVFATWASRQAGRTIRGEDLLEQLAARAHRRSRLHLARTVWRWFLRRGLFRPDTRLGRVVREVHTPFDAWERASEAVARGNLRVFAEIGRVFACGLAGGTTEALVSSLRPGPAPDGQDGLRRAFTCYDRARAEADPAARRALVLPANLEIGRHEQTRLQPEIVAALESGPETVRDLGARVLAVLAPPLAARGGPWRRPVVALLGAAAARYRRFARRLVREVVTEALMLLTVPPDLILHLGRRLPREVPAELRSSQFAALREFWDDCLRGRADGDCGADDWGILEQRMVYILHLFAAFHDDRALLGPPFTSSQTRAILAGALPEGVL